MSDTFTFDAQKHIYRVGARQVPATTQVLTGSGLVAFSFVAQDVLERRGDLGREVHRACHLDNMKTKFSSVDPRVQPHLDAWRAFKSFSNFKLIQSEYQNVAEINGMRYGYTFDCEAFINGTDHIIELKIGKIYPHHGVQLAAYAAGAPHISYTAPLARFMARQRIVVELRSNGVPKVHRFDQRSDYDVWVSSLHVATWKGQWEKYYREEKA